MTLKRAAEFVREGFELILVAPEIFWYSGLATGVLAGIYPPHRIDLAFLRSFRTDADPPP